MDSAELVAPAMLDEAARIRLTASCRDADTIAKVAEAGEVKCIDGQRVQVMHNGLHVLADGYYGAWMTDLITRLRGHHEPQEERVFHEILGHLPSDGTMLEVGAFWSYYSLWFLKDAPDRRAVAIEPDPTHLAVGRTNARLNRLSVDFRQGIVTSGPSRRVTFQTESSGMLELDAINLGELIDDIGPVNLLLCDAQGGETDLMRALAPVVAAGKIDYLLISTHAEPISGDPLTHQRCLAAIEALGGTILIEHDVHESFSGDGLIAVKFGAVPDGWITPSISRNRYSTSLFRNPLYDLAEARSGAHGVRDAAETVRLLYRRFLGREADEAGLTFHVEALQRSGDIGAVIAAIVDSPESEHLRQAKDEPAQDGVPDALHTLLAPDPASTVVVVDIGAQRLADQRHAYAPLADAGFRLEVVGFEPLSHRLEDRVQAEPDGMLRMLPYFVGSGAPQTFHVGNFDATSSLLPFNETVTASFVELRGLHTVAKQEVQTRRIDDVLCGIGHVDLLKLDIQGTENIALAHAVSVLARTSVVHCEVLFADLYRGQGYFADIDTLLRAQGFVLVDILNPHRGGYVLPSERVSGNRLLWADAVYFRPLTGEVNAAQRRTQAAIALFMYAKPGLAERLTHDLPI